MPGSPTLYVEGSAVWRSDDLGSSWRQVFGPGTAGVSLEVAPTDPNTVLMDRLVPFFIDWGSSPHPSATAARGATLVQLRAEHPDPDRAQKILDALGLGLRVSKGSAAGLIATIDSPRGRVELR